MKNIFLIFFGFFALISGISIFSVDAASVIEENAEKEIIPFEKLTDYQVLLTGNEGGIATYSGVKDNLRLTFDTDKEAVIKIIFGFDINAIKNNPSLSQEIVDIINILMPNQISDNKACASIFQEKMSDLNEDRDQAVFNLDKSKIEVHVTNGLVNVRVTK